LSVSQRQHQSMSCHATTRLVYRYIKKTEHDMKLFLGHFFAGCHISCFTER
jgi:hypothetical protein